MQEVREAHLLGLAFSDLVRALSERQGSGEDSDAPAAAEVHAVVHPWARVQASCPVKELDEVLVLDHEYDDSPTLASVVTTVRHAGARGGWLLKVHLAGCAYRCAHWVELAHVVPPSAAEQALKQVLNDAIEAVEVAHLPGEAVTLRGGAFGSGKSGRRRRVDLHCCVTDVAIRRGGAGAPFVAWYRCEPSPQALRAAAEALGVAVAYQPPDDRDGAYEVRGERVVARAFPLEWFMGCEVSPFMGGAAAFAAAEERRREAEKQQRAAAQARANRVCVSLRVVQTQGEAEDHDASRVEVSLAVGGGDERTDVDEALAAALAAPEAVRCDSNDLFAASSMARVLQECGAVRVALESSYLIFEHRAAALPVGAAGDDSGLSVQLLSTRSAGPTLRRACNTIYETRQADRLAKRKASGPGDRARQALRAAAGAAIFAFSLVARPSMATARESASPRKRAAAAGANSPPPPPEKSLLEPTTDGEHFFGRRVEVAEGDTLWSIVASHCAPGANIANAIERVRAASSVPEPLLPGDMLALPPGVCVVRANT